MMILVIITDKLAASMIQTVNILALMEVIIKPLMEVNLMIHLVKEVQEVIMMIHKV